MSETRKCNYKKQCEYCGNEFYARTKKQRFCNLTHKAICCICGKEIILTPQQLRNNAELKDFVCSAKCAAQKSKNTKLEKNNGKYFSDEQKQKIRETTIKNYGGIGFAVPELRQKSINTFKQQNNITDYKQEIRDRIEATNLERYGNVSPFGNQQIINKSKQTNLEKYGVEYYAQTDESKHKNSIRMKHLYSNGLYEKTKQTNLEKYGVEHIFQVPQIREESKNTKLKKYGNANYTNIEKATATKIRKYGSISYNNRTRCIKTNLKKYGVKYTCILPEVYTKNKHIISKNNKQIFKKLQDKNIQCKYEYRIDNKSFDIYLPEHNTVLEIDPAYTHQATGNRFFGKNMLEPLDKNYHIEKTKLANKNNLNCIHIFDWDNIDKIINMFSNKETLYARKLKIKEVSQNELDEFLNNYHLQGSCKGQTIKLGLYNDNQLIEIMTFGKPRYNKNYEWELLRLCTHKDYKVVGGSNKLFKYFVRNYTPKSIISYCDMSKFSGQVYDELGFKLLRFNPPSLHWCKGKTKHITDNLLRQRGFDQLFNTNYGKGTSNYDLMIQHKWFGVYDCGQNTYIWEE